MRVFISWSGDLSRQLGEAFRNWLPSALQYVKPYFTPSDIDKGARWASEISKELSASAVCVIILTRDNLASSWIMFEAGAISTALDNTRVCPIIFDLEPTDLQGPLSQFQITKFTKTDIQKLFDTINSLAGENKLDDPVAKGVFEKWWPDLESTFNEILKGHVQKPHAEQLRSDRDLIEEILLMLRSEERQKPAYAHSGSPTEKFLDIIKYVIDEDGLFALSSIQPKIIDVRKAIAARSTEGATKDHVLAQLDQMIASIPEPPKPRRKPSKSDMDDDIPF